MRLTSGNEFAAPRAAWVKRRTFRKENGMDEEMESRAPSYWLIWAVSLVFGGFFVVFILGLSCLIYTAKGN